MENEESFDLGCSTKQLEVLSLKLRDGDVLVVKLDDDDFGRVEHVHALGRSLKKLQTSLEEHCGRKVEIVIIPKRMDLDVLRSDKVMAQLRAEIDELKATVAKYVTK